MNSVLHMMRIKVILVLCLLVISTLSWSGELEKTQEASGTAPIGAYTFPANFSAGRATGSGKTHLGIEVTRDDLTNPATVVELVVEVSYDGGTSWPPDCLSTATCVCHNATQDEILPVEARVCSLKTQGSTTVFTPNVSATECHWDNLVTDANTRMRARLNVCGASATGTVSVTWR